MAIYHFCIFHILLVLLRLGLFPSIPYTAPGSLHVFGKCHKITIILLSQWVCCCYCSSGDSFLQAELIGKCMPGYMLTAVSPHRKKIPFTCLANESLDSKENDKKRKLKRKMTQKKKKKKMKEKN